MNFPSWKAVGLHTGDVLELGLGSLNVSVACHLCALLSHFLTVYHLVTAVESCCITRFHVYLLFFTSSKKSFFFSSSIKNRVNTSFIPVAMQKKSLQ